VPFKWQWPSDASESGKAKRNKRKKRNLRFLHLAITKLEPSFPPKGRKLRQTFFRCQITAEELPIMSIEKRVTRIPLPNGDALILDAEFLKIAGGVTSRTGSNWDNKGCPHTYIGNCKYRPEREGLEWLASRIRRRNPKRITATTAPRFTVSKAT
jgi:hypothetical protein